MLEHYEPKGVRFDDAASGRDMLLVNDRSSFDGWVCCRHPDGQWITLRRATDEDQAAIASARPVAKPCKMCDDVKAEGIGPSHDGSRACRCGSIASGGDRAHCTCRACF